MRHIVRERGLGAEVAVDSAGTYAGHTGELPDARIFRMREFFSRHPGWDHVPDPYYDGAEGFELVLDMLEDGCEGILAHLGK